MPPPAAPADAQNRRGSGRKPAPPLPAAGAHPARAERIAHIPHTDSDQPQFASIGSFVRRVKGYFNATIPQSSNPTLGKSWRVKIRLTARTHTAGVRPESFSTLQPERRGPPSVFCMRAPLGTQRMSDDARAAVHVRLGQISPGVFGPVKCRLDGVWIRRPRGRHPGVEGQCLLAQYLRDKQDYRRASEGVAYDLEA